MKIRHLVISVSFMVSASFQSSAAEDMGFIGEVRTSNKDIEFTTFDGASGTRSTFAPKLLTLDYAGTYYYQDFYTRLKLSQTIRDDTIFTAGGDVAFASRSDLDITFGFYLGSGLTGFAGYKRGEFEATVLVDAVTSDVNSKTKFLDDGPFVGVSYSLPLEQSSFSFLFAYADMDGEI